MSGTYNSAVLASEVVKESHNVENFGVDGRFASYSVIFLIEHAMELVQEGMKPLDIVEEMRALRTKISTILCLPTLMYLKAGGRVSFTKFLIGRLLGLKPITKVNTDTGENKAVGTA